MKQLYCKGAYAGVRQGQADVWASSADCPPEHVEAGRTAAGYLPPPGRDPAPIRLALLNSASAGRLLCHVAPNGGTYFAHLLLGVPPSIDAQHVIQTWGSQLWQRHESGPARALPEMPYLPVADVLSDAALRDWLAEPARRELLAFVFTALLTQPGRVFLAASADDVAQCVYAVTRAVPAGLLGDFTFSTYEPNPLACAARLIGCDGGELPEACYGPTDVAYHAESGRHSVPRSELPFAAFAVEALASGDATALDEFRATWQRLGLTEARYFDPVFRLARGEALSKSQTADVLRVPALAAWVAARADAVGQFLDWALDDRSFATTAFAQALAALRPKPDTLTKLAKTVQDAGIAALKAGDRGRAANALEVVLPMVAPAKASAVWGELVKTLTDPDQLAWDVRWYLLPRFVRYLSAPAVGKLSRWLDVPADQLGALLALDLPHDCQLAAGRASLAREADVSPTLARSLAVQPSLALNLLQPAGAPDADGREVKLFDALLTEAPDRPWVEEALRQGQAFPVSLLNRFLEVALAAGRVDAPNLIRGHGPALLTLLSGQRGLDRTAWLFLKQPPADLLTDPTLLDFQTKLADTPNLSAEVRERLSAAAALTEFLRRPVLTDAALAPAAAALALDPPLVTPTARQDMLERVNARLAESADAPSVQAELEATLARLGSTLAANPSALYRELLRRQQQRRGFWRQTNLQHAFLAVALGATESADLAKQTHDLESEAFALGLQTAKLGGAKALRALDERTEAWPQAARTQWNFLMKAVRPRGVRGLLRDAAIFMAGAGVVLAVIWFTRVSHGW